MCRNFALIYSLFVKKKRAFGAFQYPLAGQIGWNRECRCYPTQQNFVSVPSSSLSEKQVSPNLNEFGVNFEHDQKIQNRGLPGRT